MSAEQTFDLHVPGLSKVVADMDAEIAARNNTIQYMENGVDVGTKGEIQYVDFTGSVTVTNPSAGLLEVNVTGGGSGLTQPQVMARTLGC